MAGEEIIAERLPDFLHEQYGSDKEYVHNLIKEKKKNREFDWSISRIVRVTKRTNTRL